MVVYKIDLYKDGEWRPVNWADQQDKQRAYEVYEKIKNLDWRLPGWTVELVECGTGVLESHVIGEEKEE